MATKTAQKRNIAPERPGARAKEAYVRISASKVRPVLNLIRGKSYEKAIDILKLTERKAADNITHCLNSAVKNAENNGIEAEELFISECFADEGPTLRRWRARARGRATRINKRTSTITIIVSRYTPEELDKLREQGQSRQSADAVARRKRVEGQRAAASQETDSQAIEEIDSQEVEETDSQETDTSQKSQTETSDSDGTEDAVEENTVDEDTNTKEETADVKEAAETDDIKEAAEEEAVEEAAKTEAKEEAAKNQKDEPETKDK